MTAPKISEAAFQQAVVDLAQYRGWLVFHVHDSRRGLGAGFPDLVLLHQRTGELVFAELKAQGGRLSQAQVKWLDALTVGGHECHVWKPSDLRTGHVTRALTPSDMPGAAPDARELLRRVVMDYAPDDCPPGCACSAATARRFLREAS